MLLCTQTAPTHPMQVIGNFLMSILEPLASELGAGVLAPHLQVFTVHDCIMSTYVITFTHQRTIKG